MGTITTYMRQKGPAFWLLHLVWSSATLAVACWPLSGLRAEVWITGSIVLAIGGLIYHMHSSAVAAREAFSRLGDVTSLLREQKMIEIAASLLSKSPTEAKRDITSTRRELLQRFEAAAPYIRSSWLFSSVLPAFIASLGVAWWLWSDTGSLSVPVAVLGSFALFTGTFFIRSPMIAAEGHIAMWEERNR